MISVKTQGDHVFIVDALLEPFFEGIIPLRPQKVSSEENMSDICTKNVDITTFKYHEEEIDKGFPQLRQKVFGEDGFILKNDHDQKLLGGMSSNESGEGRTKDNT